MIRLLGLFGLAGLLAALPSGRAQDPPRGDELRFRRVFVPEGVEPEAAERLTPLRAADFERLAAAASGAAEPPRARIETAHYECRWLAPAALRGTGRLKIAVDGPPAVVWLEPCNVAIRSLAWEGPARPLRWGRTGEGRTALLAEASGELRIEWSTAGTQLPARGVAFNLELPQAPVAHLSVERSAGQRAEWRSSSGVAIEPLAGGWPLREPRGSLQISPAPSEDEPAAVGFRENNLYELSPRGLSLAAEWTFDVRGRALPRLTLDVDRPLRLLSARYGEQELALFPRDGADDGQRVELSLETGLEGGNRVVTLAAVADRPLEDHEPLPRLRAVDCFWQQGESTLRVVAPRSLSGVEHVSGRTVRIAPLAAPAAGAAWELQHYAPDWSAALRASRPAPTVELRTATEIVCSPHRHRAECRAAFRGLPRGVVRLSAQSPGAWRITRIEQVGATRAECDWEEVAGPNPGWLVTVPGGRPGEDLVLRIEADHDGGPLAAGGLPPLAWNDVELLAAEVALRPAEGAQLVIDGDEAVNWRRTEFVSSRTTPFVPMAPGGWSTDARQLPETLRVEAIARSQDPTAYRWRLTARPEAEAVLWEYELALAAAPAESRSLDVEFEPPVDEALHWSLADLPDELPAQQLDATELAAIGKAPEAEVWRIELPPGPIGDWRLRTVRTTRGAPSAVCFPRVLGAQFQGGELLLKGSAGQFAPLEVSGLESVSRSERPHDIAARYLRRAEDPTPLRAAIGAPRAPRAAVVAQRGLLRLGPRGDCATEYVWTADGRATPSLTLRVREPAVDARLKIEGRAAQVGSPETRVALPAQPACRVALDGSRESGYALPWRRVRPWRVDVDAITTTASWRVEIPGEWLIVHPRLARAAGEGVSSIYEWPTEQPPVVWVVQRDFLTAMSVLAALLGAALGAGPWRPARSVLVIGLALATALLVPTPLAAAPLALPAGWATGMLARGLTIGLGRMVSSRRAAAGWAAGAILIGLSAPAPGQIPPAPSEPYEVYIPVDEQRRPRPDGWLVPEPLLDALLAAAPMQAAPRGVWIERADYRGELLWSGGSQPELRVTAMLRVHVFGDEPWLRLPWSPARVSAAQVTIDGALAETVSDTDQLRVRLPGPGTFDVQLPLAPAVQTIADEAAAELALPSVPASRLELRVSPDLHVTAPTARGLVEQDFAGHRLLADLGSATRLAIRWTTDPSGNAGPEVEAEQWLLFEIRPGAVLLRTKFAYRVLSGAMSELRFTADPRLRWLPLTQDGVATASLAPSPLDPTAATVPLVQPVAGQWTFEATLLLTGHSGIGQLAWPRLEPRDVALRRRFVAVTIDPALSGEIETESPRGAAVDFESRWGEPLPAGAEVFEATTDRWPEAVVRTRPRGSESRVLQRLRHFVDRPESRWELSVRWPAGETPGPAYRIQVPRELHVDRVELRAEERSRGLRFARRESGDVEIALEGDSGAEPELIVRGRKATDDGPIALPRITLAGAALLENSVELWREAGSRLLPIEDQERRPDLADENAWQGDWRRVASYSGPAQVPTELALRDHAPRARLTQALVLGAEPELVRCLVRVEATDLPLEELLWDLSPGWEGPLTCVPEAQLEIVERPAGRVVRARFRQALQPGDVVTIQGLRARGPLEVPALMLKSAELAGQYLVFEDPAAVTGWELEGWRETAQPTEFAALPAGAIYRAEGASRARRRVDPTGQAPRIVLAEYRVRVSETDRWLGQMTWLVDPRGSDRLRFRLDGAARLEAARCDGLETAAQADGAGGYVLPLGSRALPQQIELLIVGVGADGLAGKLVAPWPIEAAIDGARWRVLAPRREFDAAPGHALPLGSTALARWQAVIELLNQAAPAIERLSPEPRGVWLAEAGFRLRAQRRQAQDMAAAPAYQRMASVEADLHRRWPELDRPAATPPPADWIAASERMAEFEAGEQLAWTRGPAPTRTWTRPLAAAGLFLLSLTFAWRFRESAEPGGPPAAGASAT